MSFIRPKDIIPVVVQIAAKAIQSVDHPPSLRMTRQAGVCSGGEKNLKPNSGESFQQDNNNRTGAYLCALGD